jgi:hypothetical protein
LSGPSGFATIFYLEPEMFKNRDYSRTENDDWILNIQPLLRDNKEAIPQYFDGKLIGWKIQYRYE